MNLNTSESAADPNPPAASRQMIRHLYRVSMQSSLSQHKSVPRKARREYARAMASIGYRQTQLLPEQPWRVTSLERRLAKWIER